MKLWFKRGLFGLVAVFIIALVGVAIFLLTFDPNAYKNKLEEIVYNRYHRTLSIEGDIELSLFPRIGLSVQDVSLSDRDSSTTFASIDSARFAVAIWPLMFNRLVVDHVAVSGFKAWVVRDEDGHFNFRDLAQQHVPSQFAANAVPATLLPSVSQATAAQAAPVQAAVIPGEPTTGTDLQIDIAGLDLKNGEIHLYDNQTGAVARVMKLDLNTGRMTTNQAFNVAFTGRLVGEYPVADAGLEGQALVQFNPREQTYSAQKMNVVVGGNIGPLVAKSATLRGSLAYSAYSEMISASNLELAIQGEMTGEQPIKGLETSLVVPQLRMDRSQAELQVEKLAYRAKGSLPDRSFDIAFDAPNLSVSPESAKGNPVSGTVKLTSKDEVLGVALTMSGLGGNASKLTLKELKLDGGLKKSNRLVQLKMTSPANWDVFAEKGSLSAMKGDIRIEDAALPGGSFEFPYIGSLQADLIEDQISSDINAVLSGSRLDFGLKATRLDNPKVDFDLKADKLDFNTLFPPVPPAKPAPAPAPKPADKPAEPAQKPAPPPPAEAQAAPAPSNTLNLAFLDSIDVSGNIAIGELKVQKVQAKEFAASVRAAEGKLAITGIKADLYEGKLDGSITANAQNAVGAQLAVNNVVLGPLLEDLAGEDRLAGRGTVNLKLGSQGSTMAALEAGLGGTVQARVRDGSIRGLNVTQTLREVNDAVRNVFSGQLPDIATRFDPSRQTQFTSLDTDIEFSNGQGTVKKLNVVAPLLRISEGSPASLDIVNEQLDLMVNVRVAADKKEEGAGALEDLKGVAIPLRISGPFDQLDYRVQWQDIANKTVKQAVQDGLVELLSNKIGSGAAKAAGEAQPSTPAEPANKKPIDPVKSIGEALKGLLGQ
ncbi:MAG TPA: AsmA family protein [Burkholderiaceae bacterium]|nr:AsmA family protein [Burkholderiaceae bacterium]